MSRTPTTRMPALAATALLLAAASGTVAAVNGAEPAKKPAAAAATALRPAQPTAQQLDLAARQYVDLRRMLALSDRCKWLPEAERVAVDNSAAERRAWLTLWGSDLAKVETSVAAGIKGDDNVVCGNPAAAKVKDAIVYGAWQMRSTWAMRGQALLDGPGRPEWFKGLSPVAKHRVVLEQTAKSLQAKYADTLGRTRPAVLKDAEQMLAATCATSKPSCPPRGDDPQFTAYAKEWIALADRYATVLATTKDKLGEPPPEMMQMQKQP